MGSGSLHYSALLSYYYVTSGHVGFCILAVPTVSWLKNWEPEVRELSPPTYFITKGQGAGGPGSWFWDNCLPFPLPGTVFTGPIQDRWRAMATRMTLCKTSATRDKDTPENIPCLLFSMNVKEDGSSCHFPSAPSLWVEFGCTGQTVGVGQWYLKCAPLFAKRLSFWSS